MDDKYILATEWGMATALEVEWEEGYDESREQAALNALVEDIPIELVAKITELDIDKINELSQTADHSNTKELR